ncbi:MAG: efflux RND transporter permease subunit [Gammaproteobacteria bacterium]|nr:efflux RND transporter permease subunit [Gammaproteobacteria bacterium]MDE0260419.1 efflux RND transporter permease subunit [Gammaproteobacteria bacterium]
MIAGSIRRPVAVAMGCLAVALMGASAWRNIPIELLPETQLPRLNVEARWPGASPETVEAFLTSPIEAAVQQVKGVEKVISLSREFQGTGTSSIEVHFSRDTDMDFARLDLSERLSALEEELPAAVQRILVQPYVPPEFESRSQRGFLRYTYTGPYTLEALRADLDDRVVPDLTQIEGVALVQASGGRERLIEIELNEDRVSSLGLSPGVVNRRINDLDLVREAGAVRAGDQEWSVTIQNRVARADEIRNTVLLENGGTLVRVSDVADVRDSYEEPRTYNRINAQPSVSFLVIREIGANTVRAADAVKARVAQLQRAGLAGTSLILDYDESEQIKEQLTDLRTRALISAFVIFSVLLLFLRSFRFAGVVFMTIAFSVLISLNLIYFGGMTLNLLTLMGLAMGFGLIVDNAIVVLESVFRRWQAGRNAVGAATEGARQVVLPILTSTATTLIVFVPFVYLQGELRVFYVPLAIVVALTLGASLLVAFTFIPALAARVLPRVRRDEAATSAAHRSQPRAAGAVPESGDPGDAHSAGAPVGRGRKTPLYTRLYSTIIGFTLRRAWLAVTVAVLAFGGSWYLFENHVTRGVLWGGGMGGLDTYVLINIELPRGSDLERTDNLVRSFEERLAAIPEVERFTSRVTGTYGQITVNFPDSLENTGIPMAIKEQMFSHSLGFTGAEVRVIGRGLGFYGGGGGASPNYSMKVLGYNYEQVREIAEDLGDRLARVPRVRTIDTNSAGRFVRERATEFVVEIERDQLARHDMSVQELVARMNAAVRGQTSEAQLKIGGDEVRYEVKLEGYRDTDVQELLETIIATSTGTGIRLGDVVSIAPVDVLAWIRREDQQYERTVAYEFAGPRRLGDQYYDGIVESTELPVGYVIEEDQGFRWSEEDRRQIYAVLAVSILLIYMVTAALFESVRLPLCVLLTVPMALIGVFLMFFYTGASFTREAYVGVIMMGGIVVNNAILLVDNINRVRRESGGDLHAAILAGTLERVRPILMTTATTVLGLLPLVLFSETADSTIWNALGYALIGGLLSSTVFVLATTPAIYLLIEGRGARAGQVAARAPAA